MSAVKKQAEEVEEVGNGSDENNASDDELANLAASIDEKIAHKLREQEGRWQHITELAVNQTPQVMLASCQLLSNHPVGALSSEVFVSLPDDVLVAMILALKGLNHLSRMSLVSSRMGSLLKRDAVWKALYKQDFVLGVPRQITDSTKNWQEHYRSKIRLTQRWRVGTFRVRALEGHLGAVTSMAYNKTKVQLITGSEDSSIREWTWEEDEVGSNLFCSHLAKQSRT
jgi:hypothetical protein